jgi:SAM-dependent methyltransferase
MTSVAPVDFREKTCSAPAARAARMAAIALRHIAGDRPVRLLDIGCGTGALVFRLAASLPQALIVGLDISSANIRAAEMLRADHAAASRISFVNADYLTYRSDPFDAIVTDGVLHLIPGPTPALLAKLAGDLRSGGALVCGMPFDCAYNRVFSLIRKGLRGVRSRPVDMAILLAARALHGREMNEAGLRERLDYMYLPPTRLVDRWMLDEAAPAAGLRVVAQYPMVSTSPSQLRHNVTVFERSGA